MAEAGWVKIRDLSELRRRLMVRVEDPDCGRSSVLLLEEPQPQFRNHAHSLSPFAPPCKTPDVWTLTVINTCCKEYDRCAKLTMHELGTSRAGCLGLAVAKGLAYKLRPEEEKKEDDVATDKPAQAPRKKEREPIDIGLGHAWDPNTRRVERRG